MEETLKGGGDSWIRQIINQSTCAWSIAAGGMSGGNPQMGNVWFTLNGNSSCNASTIPAGATLEMKFTTSNGACQGNLTISDSTGASNAYDYSVALGGAPYIGHNGSTGGAALNEPGNGSITIVQCKW